MQLKIFFISFIIRSKSRCHDGNEITFVLDGYDATHVTRKSKRGGGVAIYVANSIEFKEINCMSFEVENIMECVTVELLVNNKKHVIIGCLYRTPGSNVDILIEFLQTI